MGEGEEEPETEGSENGETFETTPEVSQAAIVGYDSNRVNDEPANDKIGILSHEEMDATDRPIQGGCNRQSRPAAVKAPRNVQNEANLESTQSPSPFEVDSVVAEPAVQKRSQLERSHAPRSTPPSCSRCDTTAARTGRTGG